MGSTTIVRKQVTNFRPGAYTKFTIAIWIEGNDDDTTSLSEKGRVKSEEFATAAGYYTLDGRKLSGTPTEKGIYIVNGKKVIVK